MLPLKRGKFTKDEFSFLIHLNLNWGEKECLYIQEWHVWASSVVEALDMESFGGLVVKLQLNG